MTHYQIWQTTDRGSYLRFTYYSQEAANLAVTWLSNAEIVEVEVEVENKMENSNENL